jgi:hypothetical protein
MKVVCVDDSPVAKWNPAGVYCSHPCGMVVRGETYTVIETVRKLGGLGYRLAEKPVLIHDPVLEPIGQWAVSRFVPADYYQAEFAVSEEVTEPQTAHA